jgi:hypothetical protein
MGGRFMLMLGENGRLKVSDCTMKDCNCSVIDYGEETARPSSGSGGGIYIVTIVLKGKGYELNMTIEKNNIHDKQYCDWSRYFHPLL